MIDINGASDILKNVFGLTKFRRGQKPIIKKLLAGESVLGILPTGGGKSLCYQLPALMFDGLTIVVSPLLALMKDQVDKLVSMGVAAARLDSSLDVTATQRVYDDLRGDRLQLLYVAPERFSSERFRRNLDGKVIALLAVDEAHCLSAWGHNFRPEYLRLARTAERLNVQRILALTATATLQVARDIARAFSIESEAIVTKSFYRANLELRTTPCLARNRTALLCERWRDRSPGPGIVYVTLQKSTEEVAAALVAAGHNAAAYHAGLAQEERDRIQEAFLKSDSMIIVATIAFGMGVDKPDIRYVDHYNMPASLEAYAQEIGRAGRDGQPATCELFASNEDVLTLANFRYGDTPSLESLRGLVTDILRRERDFTVSIRKLSTTHDIRESVVKTALAYLETAEVVTSIGASYGQYQLKFEKTPEEIEAALGRDANDFLDRVLDTGKTGRIWSTITVAQASETLDVKGIAIGSLMGELEARGLATVKPSLPLVGYRRSPGRHEIVEISQNLLDLFEHHETRDVKRLSEVVNFVTSQGCLTRRLLSYFGEELGSDCGHCGPCLGMTPSVMPEIPPPKLGRREKPMLSSMLQEKHGALATPRQIARFLCGLTSPATIQAKLTKDPRFGILEIVPFPDVLAFVTKNLKSHESCDS